MNDHRRVEAFRMVDLETSVPTKNRRKRPPRVVVAGLVAAAALAAIVFVATLDDDDVNPADEPPPTVTVPPTLPPRALFGAHDERFVPGTYFIDEVDGTPTARISVTIGTGWSNLLDGSAFDKRGRGGASPDDDIGLVSFSRPDRVFLDACHASDGVYPGPVTTLDGLVAALSGQAGWADVTAPSDIVVDGYAGKAFQRTAPAVLAGCSIVLHQPRLSTLGTWPAFRSWEPEYDGFGRSFYEPGEIETVWVLDIAGDVVVISTRLLPGSSAAAHAEFAAVLDSIRIDRG